MPLYLGLDSSTQSLSAIVLEIDSDRRRVVFEESMSFDEGFPEYGTEHGVLRSPDQAVAVSSPLMWAAALDAMMARIAWRIDVGRLAAIAGSAQQHGSVYLNASATAALAALDPERPLVEQVEPMLSRAVSPIWMDSSTGAECREIAAAVGGDASLAQHTGSRAFERFTGPQIRKFASHEPAAYAATDRIHLVSSFLASLLAGRHAPIDPGDGSGMNLMDLTSANWWDPAVAATAPGLAAKLPALAPASSIVGPLATYWQKRYGFPSASVVVWSGDNPCSLIGTGLVREGRLAVSLGTSDTVFGLMEHLTGNLAIFVRIIFMRRLETVPRSPGCAHNGAGWPPPPPLRLPARDASRGRICRRVADRTQCVPPPPTRLSLRHVSAVTVLIRGVGDIGSAGA